MERPKYEPVFTYWDSSIHSDVSLSFAHHIYDSIVDVLPQIYNAVYRGEFKIAKGGNILHINLQTGQIQHTLNINLPIKDENDLQQRIISRQGISLVTLENSLNSIDADVQSNNVKTHGYTLVPEQPYPDYELGYELTIDGIITIHFKEFDVAKRFAEFLPQHIIDATLLTEENFEDFQEYCKGSRFTTGSRLIRLNNGLVTLNLSNREILRSGNNISLLRTILYEDIAIKPTIVRSSYINKFKAYDIKGELSPLEDFLFEGSE